MKTKADIIIVGAGIAGNSAAYYCTKRGQSVIVLEENMICHGGTSRCSGGCRHSGRDPRDKPLAVFAIRNIWPTLEEETGVDVEYTQAGSLNYGWTEDHYRVLQEKVRKTREEGFDAFLLDRKEIYEKTPWISRRTQFACWVPTDGHADPMKAGLAFYKRARELGCTFITGEKVIRINKIRGRACSVTTERGNTYEGGKIIVTAAWGSRAIVNTVGIDVPLTKSYVNCLVTEASPPVSKFAYNGMSPSNYYGHQTRHGSWMFGGSGGRESCFSDLVPVDYSQALQTSARVVVKGVSEDIPMIAKLKVVRTWAGWVDKCCDEVPILGKVEEVPDLILYCGSHGIGFGIGPAVGYVLSELAADMETSVDVKSLNPNRFDYMKKNPRYHPGKEAAGYFRW